jgi:flagellar basal-body rod modification protein FlgD
MADISNYLSVGSTSGSSLLTTSSSDDNLSLDMTDFLSLMITELTNQSIDDTADTSDMLNQMVMMQMVQALVNMTDASVMSYSASLVGKEVTVGQYDANGNLTELVGTVSGTGTMDGNQVIFIDDKYYQLSEIMAVGRLPATVEETAAAETVENTDNSETVEETSQDASVV